MDINTKKIISLPIMPLRGVVTFPNIILHFDVARERSMAAIKLSMENYERKIFLASQKDIFIDEPTERDIYKTGVICEIKQLIKSKDGTTRVLVEGIQKAKLVDYDAQSAVPLAGVKIVPNYSSSRADDSELNAITRSVKDIFEEYSSYMPKMPAELHSIIVNQTNPYKVFESIVFNTGIDWESKQELLEAGSIIAKLTLLFSILTAEVEVLSIEKEIHETVKNNIDKSQRDYYLREQMQVISQQLGDDENVQDEVYKYLNEIFALGLDEVYTEKLSKEAERLLKMPSNSQEAFVSRNYLDTVLELPWNKYTNSTIDLERASRVLEKDHYGLKKVKERILETIAVQALCPDNTGNIICLVGPPGVGKTSVGKSIARALGRKYVRVSLGGVKDEAEIRGHRKTYIGSMPGRIIAAMKQAGTKNPVILLDEIDKMSNDFKGDPASAMLEVLDSEQNSEFRDHYLEIPFDLSRVLFITTANVEQNIPEPLYDRMEIIEVPSYTREEKFNIAKLHLIPKQIKKNGLKGTQIRFNDDAIRLIIDNYTRESGVRTLERTIASLCRKAAKQIVGGSVKRVVFKACELEAYLGNAKYHGDEMSRENEIGVVNGLAWTASGGVLMPLEALVLEGKGNVELTGSLGEVMKESAKIAVSWCRGAAKRYSADPDFYKNNDIHLHAPEGAVPKDGPSAGVTMVTAMISALSQTPVRCDVAMTGEITLHGKVLAIGGLREKSMAAYRNGIKTVIAPSDNRKDLEEIDDAVKANIDFRFVSTIDEVLDIALLNEHRDDNKTFVIPETFCKENMLTV